MQPLAGKSAVIFDMDGVLMHSSPIHAKAYNQTLMAHGLAPIDYRRYAGQRTDQAITAILRAQGVDPTSREVAELSAAKSELARRLLRSHPPLARHCRFILSDLRLRHRLALATSASRGTLELFLQATHSADLFDSILCGEDITQAKPDPQIYERTLARLKISPSEAIVVEDSPSGVEAAWRAGMDVVGITGTVDAATLSALPVVRVIDQLEELCPRTPHSAIAWEEALDATTAQPLARDDWTAIIPAAGHGSRLGYHLPKILYPLLGRPLLDWLLDLLCPVCSRVVLVLSPDGRDLVAPVLKQRLGNRGSVAVQPRAVGMADAVLRAEPFVPTPNSMVVWCDQVLLSPATVTACAKLHQRSASTTLTMPTVIKSHPYIHFQRDDAGRVERVLQAREDEIHTRFGENDCGLFAFRSENLFGRLRELCARGRGRGRSTGELNLLQLIPDLCPAGEVAPSVKTFRIWDPAEATGVNTPSDAAYATRILQHRLARSRSEAA